MYSSAATSIPFTTPIACVNNKKKKDHQLNHMKLLITTILLTVSIHVFAQFTKGDKVLGGALYISTQHAPESPSGGLADKSNSLSITPNFGVLLNENLELGLQAGLTSNAYENSATGYINEYNSNSWNGGLYIRRYYTMSEKFLFAIKGDFNYTTGKTHSETTYTSTNETIENNSRAKSLHLGLSPNFIFFPSTNWSLQASIGNIGYTFLKNSDEEHGANLFNITYGTVGLGVSYYFRK